MGRFQYSKSEKETLKVLKSQEQQTKQLEVEYATITNGNEQQALELEDIRRRIESLAKKVNIPLPQSPKTSEQPIVDSNPMGIPTWEDCIQSAEKKVQGDVEIENLLSKEEFDYCIAEVERINSEFSAKTGIWNKKDLSFIVVATALQTARWILIQQFKGKLGDKIDSNQRLPHDDKSIKDGVKNNNKKFQDTFKNHGHKESKKSYKSWEQIIFSSAPYDTSVNSSNFGENLEGRYHRYKTLGHDPILDWIFGTANFITDTCTLSNYNSYRIARTGTPSTPCFSEPVDLLTIFDECFDSIKEDWLRLPAGLFAQYVHLKSDVFTKLGLPVPLLSTFSEELAGKLYRSQYDSLCLLKDIAIVGNQAYWSIFINMIITLLHGFLYNPQEDGERELYEVRTRKILSISNALASSGNLAYVIETEDIKSLDAGGLLVTLYRLFTDIKFMTRVKENFIQQEMDKVLEQEIKDLDLLISGKA